jgi:hypothetical protein
MEKGTIPVEDRRLIIPEQVYLTLEDIAAEKRKTADEIAKPLITPRSTAQHILSVAVERYKRGHYVGKQRTKEG